MLFTISKNNFSYSILATLIYFLLSFIGILNHELWLDEAHSFLIGRDSTSFSELLYSARLEGHPFLWCVILWMLTKFTHDVFYMQLLHILITSSGVFLLFYHAPLENLKKILFAFSYFIFYEYNIISRNYGICFLGVTLFCILICHERKNYILISLSLALLANSHFLGLLLSIPLALVLFIRLWEDSSTNRKALMVPSLILMTAYMLCLIQIMPPEDSPFIAKSGSSLLSMKRLGTFSSFFKAFYQFPDLLSTKELYNTNLFTANKIVGLIFTFVFPIVLAKAFLDRPLSLMILFVSGIIICLFFFTGFIPSYTVRHWGFIFLGFYTALWIEKGIDQRNYLEVLKKIIPSFSFKRNHKLKNAIVYSALFVQAMGGIILYGNDFRGIFSHGKSVAKFIQENHYEKEFIILSNFRAGPPVAAYLDRKLYYPESHSIGSFCIWNTYPAQLDKKTLLERISNIPNQNRALLLMDSDTDSLTINHDAGRTVYENSKLTIQYLKSFENDLIRRENFNLYWVTYKK